MIFKYMMNSSNLISTKDNDTSTSFENFFCCFESNATIRTSDNNNFIITTMIASFF